MYTSGNEFSLNGLNYVGSYNIGPDGSYYTELFFIFGTSIQLQPSNNLLSLYKYTKAGMNFIKHNNSFYSKYKFISIPSEYISPLEEDYKCGKIVRYFIYYKYSDILRLVSKSTYDRILKLNSELYLLDFVLWLISGNLNYVIQENKKKIENSKITSLYKYIVNYRLFYK